MEVYISYWENQEKKPLESSFFLQHKKKSDFFDIFFKSDIILVHLYLFKINTMKKTVKNLIHKPESERSKKEKLIRDIAFFGVVVYAATLTFLLGSAQADQTIAEAEAFSAHMQSQQVVAQ